jgi:hypothetical protein
MADQVAATIQALLNHQLNHQPPRAMTERHCGDCQLCCKLLPVRSLDKGAGERCKHQRHGKGCAVYHQLGSVSPECRLWSCRWLINDDAADLRRPDRSHYVIDLVPDFVSLRDNATGELQHIQVVQIWVDPKFPDAHRDPALRAYLERRAKDNIIGLVRWDNEKAIALFPPQLSNDGRWHEQSSNFRTHAHTPEEKVAALGRMEIHFR